MLCKNIQVEYQDRVSSKRSRKSVLQKCHARVQQEYQENRVSCKECQETVSSKSVLSRVSNKSVSKSVQHECPARVSGVRSKVSSKSVMQECPARVLRKSF